MRGLSFSESTAASGPLVFAGYGLVIPETDGFSYDSYATLDVADKIVLVLRYFPEDSEGDLRALFSRYSQLRFKAAALRRRGARGMVVVTGPRSPGAGRLVRLTADAAVADSGIAAVSVTGAVAEALFEHVPDRTLDDAQRELDDGNPHVAGFEIPVEVTLDARVSRERRTGYNVVGYLPPTAAEPLRQALRRVLGAHYDHLGRGETGSLAGLSAPPPPPPPPGVERPAVEAGAGSRAEAGDDSDMHNGADDNASGVAAVLAAGAELAGRAARARHRAGLLVGRGDRPAWLGRSSCERTGPLPMDEVAAYVNFDMVGRMREQCAHGAGAGEQQRLAGPRRRGQRRVRVRSPAGQRSLPADRLDTASSRPTCRAWPCSPAATPSITARATTPTPSTSPTSSEPPATARRWRRAWSTNRRPRTSSRWNGPRSPGGR